MKKLLLYTIYVFAIINAGAQNTPADEFAGKLLSVFSNHDVDGCRRLALDSSKANPAIRQYVKSKVYVRLDVTFAQQFENVINMGVETGIDWTQVKPGTFIYGEDTLLIKGHKVLKGHVNFTCKGKPYVLAHIGAILTPEGYRFFRIGGVARGNVTKYVEPRW